MATLRAPLVLYKCVTRAQQREKTQKREKQI